jgi:hypothetical protein
LDRRSSWVALESVTAEQNPISRCGYAGVVAHSQLKKSA